MLGPLVLISVRARNPAPEAEEETRKQVHAVRLSGVRASLTPPSWFAMSKLRTRVDIEVV